MKTRSAPAIKGRRNKHGLAHWRINARRLSRSPTKPPPEGLHFKSILVPTDFSDEAGKTLAYAMPFASKLGGRLTLLHVIEPLTLPDFASSFPLAKQYRQLTVECERHLEKMLPHSRRLAGPNLVRQGHPVQEIVQAARELGSDLILMATHGRTGLKHALLGSTTERVVRHAPCSVLVLRRNLGVEVGPNFAKILVPIDFSNYSRVAFRYAMALARQFQAELVLWHVVHPVYPFSGADGEIANYASLVEDMREAAALQINDFIKESGVQGLKVLRSVSVGSPATEITDAAKRLDSDLIVIATHGRTGLKRALLGSTTENVLRFAPCPVLVVRERNTGFADRPKGGSSSNRNDLPGGNYVT